LNKDIHNVKILIAPLDWGLGHATRCIPLIQNLLTLGSDVTVAASGKIQALLQNEFPQLNFLHLPGYQISYSKSKRALPAKILTQIPKILKIIRFENKWLQQAVHQYGFSAVISDNRYGLYTDAIPSIFLTHQLYIKTNFFWLDHLLQGLNYRYINRFSECWIPDYDGEINIAGQLSHPEHMPVIPVKYIGALSRFDKGNSKPAKYKWMVILSGPEPQRTIFEKKIFETAQKTNDQFLIVRGLPDEAENKSSLSNCAVFNHLNTADMLTAIDSSEFIISRCGYTTVMEMLSLTKKTVFVPTPGQTEQEYLAQHLSKQHYCYTFEQHEDFNFHLDAAKHFTYSFPQLNMHCFEPVLQVFVQSLQ
jgi:uncharacterized protein (TIGR00661 family)